jgi:hypothetical protein
MDSKEGSGDECRQVVQVEDVDADRRQKKGGTAVKQNVGPVKTPRSALAHLKI